MCSPFNKEEKLKQKFENDEFFEIHLNTPLEECIKETKKLYYKAKNNKSINNIGIGGLYENI